MCGDRAFIELDHGLCYMTYILLYKQTQREALGLDNFTYILLGLDNFTYIRSLSIMIYYIKICVRVVVRRHCNRPKNI